MLSRLGEAQHRIGQVNEARKTYQRVVELQERERKRKEEEEEEEEGGEEEGREGGKVALRYGIALHDQEDPVGACGWYYRAIQLGRLRRREGGREGGREAGGLFTQTSCTHHSHISSFPPSLPRPSKQSGVQQSRCRSSGDWQFRSCSTSIQKSS